jgi:hypothetical protein
MPTNAKYRVCCKSQTINIDKYIIHSEYKMSQTNKIEQLKKEYERILNVFEEQYRNAEDGSNDKTVLYSRMWQLENVVYDLERLLK